MTDVRLAHVGPEVIAPSEVAVLVAGPAAGAVVTFVGAVRDTSDGRGVEQLDYEAHPDSPGLLGTILATACAPFDDVSAVAAAHRTGSLAVGEVALAVAVSAGHREQAFAAAAAVVDAIKAGLPVWKRQVYGDGAAEWVNAS